MAGPKLTAATVATLPYKHPVPRKPPGKRKSPLKWCAYWHHKLKGFGLRVTAQGARSYVVKFRLRGSPATRLRTIGPPTKYTFREAYEEARKALRDAEVGRDYFETIKRERAQTLGDVWRYYVSEHLSGKDISERTRRDHGFLWTNHAEREFGNRSLADISPEQARDWHRRVTRSGVYVANRAAQALRAAWNHARRYGRIPRELENPFAAIKLNKESPRQTILEPHQVPKFVEALNAVQNPFAAAYLKLLFFSGARRTELLRLEWPDVDIQPARKGEPRTGSILLRHTKGGEPRRVALSQPAIEILEGLSHTDNRHVFAGAKPHVAVEPEDHWRRVRKAAGLPDLRMHDLRRSFGSWLGAAGFGAKLIGAALGHKTDITSRVYIALGEATDIKRQLATAHAKLAEEFRQEKPRAEVVDLRAKA
jgi:integrase